MNSWLTITSAALCVVVVSNLQGRLVFGDPTKVDNPYLPLRTLRQDILEGIEKGQKIRVVRTKRAKLGSLLVNGRRIKTLIVEDRETKEGKLEEDTRDYFAQADNGAVCYLGEDVDTYFEGQVTGHSGAWSVGKKGAKIGVVMPGNPKLGDLFKSEDVAGVTTESDEVVAVDETVTVPAGTFRGCIKVKESSSDRDVEYKYYAKGIGVIREQGADVDLKLVSHR